MAIYYLDIDDEITAAATRIRESGDTRIALVIQGGSRIATSRINFRLLAREAQRHGRKLAIVAPDPSVRSLAQSADLPVYASVGEFQKADTLGGGLTAGAVGLTGAEAATTSASARREDSSPWRAASTAPKPGAAPRAKEPVVVRPPRSFRPEASRLIAAGAVLVLLVTLAGGFLLWPSATIVLTLRADPVGPSAMTIKVDPTIKTPDDASLTVPGATKSFSVQASGTFEATGENVVDTAAVGNVTFHSGNTGSAVTVPKGTQVETASRIAFATTAAVTVPKATVSGLTIVPSSAEVAVVAVKTGAAGNVAAGAIVNVPPSLATALVLADGQVTNKQPTTGGSHTVTPFVQESDLNAAASELEAKLSDSLHAKVSQQAASAGDVQLYANSARMGDPAFYPSADSLLNAETATFDLSVTATGTATAASEGAIRAMAERKLTAAARSGYSIVDGTVEVSLGSATASGADVLVAVSASAMQAPTLDVNALKSAIKGKTAAEAKAYLTKYGEADVSIDPFWATTVPGLDFRVDVRIVAPVASSLVPATPRQTAQPRPSESATASAVPSATETATPEATVTPEPLPTDTPVPSDGATPVPSDGATPVTSPSPGAT